MSTHGRQVGNLVRLEIEASDLTNLIANPASTGSTTGWSSPSGVTLTGRTSGTLLSRSVTISGSTTVQNLYASVGAFQMAFGSGAALYAEVVSASFAVVPGRWVGYQASAADSQLATEPAARIRSRVLFYDASSNLIGTSDRLDTFRTSDAVDNPWLWKPVGATALVPTGAVSARIGFTAFDRSAAGVDTKPVRTLWLAGVMVVMSDSQTNATSVPFSASGAWQNIVGSSKSIRIRRGGDVDGVVDDLQPGQMTAVIADALFDPARNVRARYGRKIRVTASSDGSSWAPIYTGRIATLDVDYTSTKGQTEATYRPQVVISATDGVTELSSVPAPFIYSAEFNAKVRELMTLTTVPYSASTSSQSSSKIGVIDDASVWDQLLLARNSTPQAKVFVDVKGRVVCADSDSTGSWAPYSWNYAARPFEWAAMNHAYNPSFIRTDLLGVGTNLTSARSTAWAVDGQSSAMLSSTSTTGAKQWKPSGTTSMLSGYSGAAAATVTVKAIVACRVRLTLQSSDATSVGSDFADFAAGDVKRLRVAPFAIPSGKAMSDYSAVVEITKSGTATAWDTVADLVYVDRVGVYSMQAAALPNFGDWWFDGTTSVEYVGGSATVTKVAPIGTFGIGATAESSAWRGAYMSYVDYSAVLGSKSIVNSLIITKQNDNEPNGEKTYGPYLNQGSVVDWGAAKADLKVIDGDPVSLAAAYLQRYANPGVTLSGITVDVLGNNEFVTSVGSPFSGRADLYDRVSFQNDVSRIYGSYVIIGIDHEITPSNWTMTLRTRPSDQPVGVTVDNGSGAPNAGPQDVVGPTGRSTELAVVDLNSVTSPGTYAQSSNTEAASGSNFPVPQAGWLEVAANTDMTMVWQRYSVYAGGSYSGETFTRTFYSGSWSAWQIVGRNLVSAIATCSAAYTATTTSADVTGLSLTVPVADGAEVFEVHVDYDVQTLTTGAGNFIFRIAIDGVEQTAQGIWVAPATAGARLPAHKTWRLTGLAPGNRTITARAMGPSGVYRVNNVHSTLIINQVK